MYELKFYLGWVPVECVQATSRWQCGLKCAHWSREAENCLVSLFLLGCGCQVWDGDTGTVIEQQLLGIYHVPGRTKNCDILTQLILATAL